MSRLGQSRIHAITRARGDVRALTGIGSGTLVLTLDGELPVEHLAVGDRIVTRRGARTLRRLSSHMAKASFTIAASALGHDRPEGAVAVGAAQAVVLRDWRAKALFDSDTASVPVSRLADGEYIAASDTPVRLWRLEFDGEEVIYAGGLELTVPAPGATGI
jgi:hypothetical protein